MRGRCQSGHLRDSGLKPRCLTVELLLSRAAKSTSQFMITRGKYYQCLNTVLLRQ